MEIATCGCQRSFANGEAQAPLKREASCCKIIIATPAYGQQGHAAYCASPVDTVASLRAADHGVAWVSNSLSAIRWARADLASRALAFEDATHIMWIDADVSWEPGAVEQLVAHDLPVVAAAYPKKQPGLELCLQWATHGQQGSSAVRRRGDHLLEASAVGAGFVLVRREVYESIMEAHPELHLWKLRPEGSPLRSWLFDFFPDGRTSDGSPDGEDFGFCKLWCSLGGEIWVDTSVVLNHDGGWAFTCNPAEELAPALAQMAAEGNDGSACRDSGCGGSRVVP